MMERGIPNYLHASIVFGESGLIYWMTLNCCFKFEGNWMTVLRFSIIDIRGFAVDSDYGSAAVSVGIRKL